MLKLIVYLQGNYDCSHLSGVGLGALILQLAWKLIAVVYNIFPYLKWLLCHFLFALQDPVLCSVTVGVSRFERCSLGVQFLYYPFFGGVGMTNGDEADAPAEEGTHGVRLRKNYSPEYGEPVVLRCAPYRIPLIELLLPHALSPVEFFRLWPSLPAIAEYTGAYAYESGGPKTTTVMSGGFLEPAVLPILSGIKALSSKPFHKVCSHVLHTVAGYQVLYSLL